MKQVAWKNPNTPLKSRRKIWNQRTKFVQSHPQDMNKFRSESPEVIQLLVRTEIFSQNYVLPPDTHTYVCVAGGKKCLFFGKFCVRTK